MNQFVFEVSDPRHIPFMRQLLLSLPYGHLVAEPELSAEEEAREQAEAQAAYDQAKADPENQQSRPLADILRELDARPGYAPQPQPQPQPVG